VSPLLSLGRLAVALFFLPTCARAHIGDDFATLRASYGGAEHVGNQLLFKHAGYSIAVYFDGTRSAMEIFVRDGSIPGKTDMTQADIDSILAFEGDGQDWKPYQPVSGTSNGPIWLRADHKVIARFNTSERILSIIENAK